MRVETEETEMLKKEDFNKMMKAIINLGHVKHERPPNPTKKDLERKFRLDMKDGKPVMQEVE